MAEFEKAKAEMTAKEKFQFSLELARLGIVASPRSVDVEGGTTIQLVINGIRQAAAIDHRGEGGGLVDVTPRGLPPAGDSWKSRMPSTRGGVSDSLKGLAHSPPVDVTPPAPAPLPRGVAILTVPRYDDTPEARTPPEWAVPLRDFED